MERLNSRSGRLLVALVALIALLVGSVSYVLANLPGSAFEGDDGNIIVTTSGNKDWANISPHIDVDLPSGSTDNAFGQGAKEDIPGPSVVYGSIPNNKSDLTRFYEANERVGTGADEKYFLYLAWERANTLGTANMDFEFNQSSTLSDNGVTPVRTHNDILITFDFAKGGNTVNLGLLRWLTSSDQGTCYSSNSYPCWGSRVDLSGAGLAEGAVNSTTITDTLQSPPAQLPANTFGEVAINLTAAGVFQQGACTNFGSAFLKSRSSASFTAELKDFIAPFPVNISNCADINIHKVNDSNPPVALEGAEFTLYNDADPYGGTRGDEDTPVSPAKTCTTDASGNCTLSNVYLGQYWVVETKLPTSPPGEYVAAPDQNVEVSNADDINLTFEDPQLYPNLAIEKKADRDVVSAGEEIGFTIAITNTGPGTANDVTLTDNLPGGTGIDWKIDPAYSGPGTCTITGDPPSEVLSCSFGDLASEGSTDVHVVSETAYGTPQEIGNTATVAAPNNDEVPPSTDTVIVQPPALTVTKTADNETVNTTDQIGFTILVANSNVDGTGTAMDVTLNDPLPGGDGIDWKIDPAYSGPGTCSITGDPPNEVLSCSFGDLAPGASASVHVLSETGINSAERGDIREYLNTATARATNHPDTTGSASVTVQAPYLTITKVANPAGPVSAGDPIGFDVVVSNAGPGIAKNVSIGDSLPTGPGINWSVSGHAGCVVTNNVFSCTGLGDLAPGESVTLHLTSDTVYGSGGTYHNTATASAGNHAEVTASAEVIVQDPNLTVTKTADDPVVSTGETIGFMITVANSSAEGTGTAKNVTLTDPLPGTGVLAWEIDVQPGGCDINGETLECTIGDLAPGASFSVHVKSVTDIGSMGEYPNTATAYASNHPDVNGSDTIMVQAPDLSATKTADAASVSSGEPIGFTIHVANSSVEGTGIAHNVTLTDQLPELQGWTGKSTLHTQAPAPARSQAVWVTRS